MRDRINVFQDVAVFDVVSNDAEVVVDLYGSHSNICGMVRFRMPDRENHATAVAVLRRWARQSTPLTLVAADGHVSLQHDRAVFAAQTQPLQN